MYAILVVSFRLFCIQLFQGELWSCWRNLIALSVQPGLYVPSQSSHHSSLFFWLLIPMVSTLAIYTVRWFSVLGSLMKGSPIFFEGLLHDFDICPGKSLLPVFWSCHPLIKKVSQGGLPLSLQDFFFVGALPLIL